MHRSSNTRKHSQSALIACVAIGAMAFMGAGSAHADLVSIGKGSGGGLSVNVNAGIAKVGATIGGKSVASVDADVAGLDAKAKVGGGNVASACVGSCNSSTSPGPTPGTASPVDPAIPGTPVAAQPIDQAQIIAPVKLTCATKDGNTTAFNGYPLRDRDGRMLGIIHSAQLDGSAKIKAISIQSVKKRCTSISNTGFTVANNAITGAFDASKSGMAFTN